MGGRSFTCTACGATKYLPRTMPCPTCGGEMRGRNVAAKLDPRPCIICLKVFQPRTDANIVCSDPNCQRKHKANVKAVHWQTWKVKQKEAKPTLSLDQIEVRDPWQTDRPVYSDWPASEYVTAELYSGDARLGTDPMPSEKLPRRFGKVRYTPQRIPGAYRENSTGNTVGAM